MKLSIFTDELGMDLSKGVSILNQWDLTWVDLRGRIFGAPIEALPPEDLPRLRGLLDDHGMRVGCLQSSLAKVHLPEAERRQAEAAKLEGLLRAADALDCHLARVFFYWQPDDPEEQFHLHQLPSVRMEQVLEYFWPLAERAQEAGLTLAFENCGVSVDECLAVLGELRMPEWGLAWDCANEWIGYTMAPDEEQTGEGMAPNDKEIAQRVAHTRCVHVKARGAVPGYANVSVPWSKILTALAEGGMKGPISIETHNPDRDVYSDVDMSRMLLNRIRAAWPEGVSET
jgi:sugar phosphate isomerase/epimerase